jgi:hypothetical protein
MDRYEWTDCATRVYCQPAEELAETSTGWALVIGDPGATALVIEGVLDELLTILDRAAAAVVAVLVAEHENAVHVNKPATRCPLCASGEGQTTELLPEAP